MRQIIERLKEYALFGAEETAVTRPFVCTQRGAHDISLEGYFRTILPRASRERWVGKCGREERGVEFTRSLTINPKNSTRVTRRRRRRRVEVFTAGNRNKFWGDERRLYVYCAPLPNSSVVARIISRSRRNGRR